MQNNRFEAKSFKRACYRLFHFVVMAMHNKYSFPYFNIGFGDFFSL